MVGSCLGAAAAGETDRVASRHAAFYAALAEQAEPHIRSTAQSAWQSALRLETGNARAALQWALESGSADVALRLVAALWMFWRLEGAFGEGRAWLERALALDAGAASAHRARALWAAAWLACQQGDYGRAAALGEELERLTRAESGSVDRRNALTVLGKVAEAGERATEAVPLFEEALAICQALGPSWHLATSYLNLGRRAAGPSAGGLRRPG